MKYKIVQSNYSEYQKPTVEEIEDLYERNDGHSVTCDSIERAATEEAEHIFDGEGSEIVFFVKGQSEKSWTKVMIDVVPVPLFEIPGTEKVK